MTFAKVMRVQMMVAGLGMALFCAGATEAQEIVNTSFDDGPNVVALAQPAAGPASAATAAGGPSTTEAPAQVQVRAAAESVGEEGTTEKMLWLGSSLIWLGAIGMYFTGPAKRFAREMRAVRESYKIPQGA
jgi:hypothetical protein